MNQLRIYNNMLMNQQAITVRPKSYFVTLIQNSLNKNDLSKVSLHASNIYFFALPHQGELTSLNQSQRLFIFNEEVSLYEEQFSIKIPYDDSVFNDLFEIEWHGVIYQIP